MITTELRPLVVLRRPTMRLMCIACFALCVVPVHATAQSRDLEAAKIQYVRDLETVRAAYLETLASEVENYVGAGDLDAVVVLRQHRGEFLLGLTSVEEFGHEESEHVTTELKEALDAYVASVAENRTAVEAAYSSAIEASLTGNDVQEATRLREELRRFESGEYGPSSMEVDSRTRSFDIRKLIGEGIKLALPLSDETIPDELDVGFQEQRFQISGVYRHDVIRLQGKIAGHFGKAVLLAPERRRTVDRHGYLWMGVRGPTVYYTVVVIADNRYEPLLSLGDLDVDTVYEWSVKSDRRELVFEIRKDGETVESRRLTGNSRTIFGFSATGRHPGNQSDLRVAID